MKSYELNEFEIELVLSALKYTAEYGYTDIQSVGEQDEYNDMLDLIEKLEPKPVKKEGWVNVYPKYASGVMIYANKQEADHWARKHRIACIRIEWEEKE